MSLGSYALWTIGYALFVFKDVPEAGEELKEHEKEARAFFSSLGELGFEVGTLPSNEKGKLGMN